MTNAAPAPPASPLQKTIGFGLPEASIENARDEWRRINQALFAGVQEGEGVRHYELRRRYTGIRRLTAEARRMMLLPTTQQDINVIYAVDPHLIRDYCVYWDSTSFQGLDFLDGEWRREEENERTQYAVYLTGSILRVPNLICLESGRSEIGEMLAKFLARPKSDPDPVSDSHVDGFEKALDEILPVAKTSARLGVSPSDISDFILQKFEALIGAGGIPLMQQHLSAARLIQVLRSGALRAPFHAMQDVVPAKERAALSAAQTAFMRASADAESVRAGKMTFYRAYTSLAREARQSRLSQKLANLRPGELFNIDALYELHVLNNILESHGVSYKVQYITASGALFDFVSAFNKDNLNLELIHPRHVFFFQDRPRAQNLDKFQAVFGGPNAFGEAVLDDDVIKIEEIEQFETNYVDLLREVRSSNSFATVEGNNERMALAEVMRQFAEKQAPGVRERLLQKLQNIAEHLALASEAVRDAFAATAGDLSVQAFEAYKRFVDNLAGKSRKRLVLVRAFGAEPSADPQAISRVVCLLIGGGFRHIVKIYHPKAIQRLGASVAEVNPIDLALFVDLIKEVEADQSGLIAEGQPGGRDDVARSLPDFVRAVYSLVEREWLLAQSFCDSALDKLEGVKATDPATLQRVEGDGPEARRRLMLHEVLLLRHYARRGIAANHVASSYRLRWMQIAADDLYRAGSFLLSVDDSYGFTTSYEPNSVRLALAAFGFALEWAELLHHEEPARRTNLGGRTLLPKTSIEDIVWRDLGTLTGPYLDHSKGEPDVAGLSTDLDTLNARISAILSDLEQEKSQPRHSQEFWRFIKLRGLEIRSLLDLMGLLGVMPLDAGRNLGSSTDSFADLLLRHESFVRGLESGGETGEETQRSVHPFSEFLVTAHQLLALREGDVGKRSEVTKLRRAELLLSLSRLDASLGSTGFPRSISRHLLSTFGPEAARELREVADRLEREWALTHT